MMMTTAADYVNNIKDSGLTIHSPITIGDPNLWIPDEYLEQLLNISMCGQNVEYPLRTRSKIIKQWICEALGYPIEKTFPKHQPRFTGQNFDVYTQKSNNLQIWNEEITPQRRYVIVGIDENEVIYKVKVINGIELVGLDKTGKITTKFQAHFTNSGGNCELISNSDTNTLLPYLSQENFLPSNGISPIDYPSIQQILPIREIYNRLSKLIGKSFSDPGVTQERNRGAGLHNLVCNALGYSSYADDGKFPDVKNQILEVKLQTSPTIDLGIVCPNSEEGIGFSIGSTPIQHNDTRYAVFYAQTDNNHVIITNVVITTGKDFFSRFQQFQGNVQNGKIQMILPNNFFL